MSDSVLTQGVNSAVVGTRKRVQLASSTVGLLWAIEIVDWLIFRGGLDGLGIHPRTLSGLMGIFLAPFLHVGFSHLIANTIPLLVLGFLASSRKLMDVYIVALVSMLVGGIGTWLFGGAGTVHLGASGVVFGFLGFLMGRGFYERSARSIALSTVVTLLFGGMLTGVLPTVGSGISWQGHLFGFLGGVLTARGMGRRLRGRKKK
jgi:membrane associated rhomboid family serine protease